MNRLKLVLTPSRLKDYAACKFRFFTRYVKCLDAPFRCSPPRELGSFVHEGEAAAEEGKPIRAAINRMLKRFKLSRGYQPRDNSTLVQLTLEAEKIVNGGIWTDGRGQKTSSESYLEWKRKEMKKAKVLAVEKRFFCDIGPLILAPKLDLVLETRGWTQGTEEAVWPVEKKVTGKWDDKNWLNRWRMDVQTTIQHVVLEEEGHNVVGVMVQPIQWSRQNRKAWSRVEPQPIGKVQRLPLKWTRKPKAVLAHFRAWMEDISKEIEQRELSNYWPTDGMANGSCEYCSLAAYCRNEGNLEPREEDEIDKFIRKGNKL